MSEAVGERGESEVIRARKRWLSQRQTVTLCLLATGALVAFVFWRDPVHKEEKVEKTHQAGISQVVFPDIVRQANPPAPKETATPTPQPPPAPPAPQPMQLSNLLPTPEQKHVRMLSYAAPPAQPTTPQTGTGMGMEGRPAQGTTVAFRGTQLPGAKAGAALDQTFLLMPGVYHCVLDTAVQSDIPGAFACHTQSDIRSHTGVVLMERGTQIVGEYQSQIHQGQSRIPTLAVTAYTPNGVPVPFNAPMADGLGRAGLDGRVDNHWRQRFGSSVLLLLTQGAVNAAQAAAQSGNGNSYVNLNGGGGLDNVATEALRNSINIPPTITKNQGDDVAFFVTAPIDFSPAYSLSVVR